MFPRPLQPPGVGFTAVTLVVGREQLWSGTRGNRHFVTLFGTVVLPSFQGILGDEWCLVA